MACQVISNSAAATAECVRKRDLGDDLCSTLGAYKTWILRNPSATPRQLTDFFTQQLQSMGRGKSKQSASAYQSLFMMAYVSPCMPPSPARRARLRLDTLPLAQEAQVLDMINDVKHAKAYGANLHPPKCIKELKNSYQPYIMSAPSAQRLQRPAL